VQAKYTRLFVDEHGGSRFEDRATELQYLPSLREDAIKFYLFFYQLLDEGPVVRR
jgi:hypothetical protein